MAVNETEFNELLFTIKRLLNVASQDAQGGRLNGAMASRDEVMEGSNLETIQEKRTVLREKLQHTEILDEEEEQTNLLEKILAAILKDTKMTEKMGGSNGGLITTLTTAVGGGLGLKMSTPILKNLALKLAPLAGLTAALGAASTLIPGKKVLEETAETGAKVASKVATDTTKKIVVTEAGEAGVKGVTKAATKTVGKAASRLLPGTGIAVDAYDVYDNIANEGDYVGAGLNTIGMGLNIAGLLTSFAGGSVLFGGASVGLSALDEYLDYNREQSKISTGGNQSAGSNPIVTMKDRRPEVSVDVKNDLSSDIVKQGLIEAARKINASPEDLNKIIAFESGWNPSIENPYSSAAGLIQIINSSAKEIGFASTEDAMKQNPTVLDQLENVVPQYLTRAKQVAGMKASDPVDFNQLAMLIFRPGTVRKHGRKNSQDMLDVTFPEAVRKVNPGIVTVGDYVSKADSRSINRTKVALARGAIVTEPTHTLIGEAGYPEAVIPLNTQGMDYLVDALNKYSDLSPVNKEVINVIVPKESSKDIGPQASNNTDYTKMLLRFMREEFSGMLAHELKGLGLNRQPTQQNQEQQVSGSVDMFG